MQLLIYSLIDEEQSEISPRASYGWKQYYNINGIYDWLDQMLLRYPRELSNYNIGTEEQHFIEKYSNILINY